MLEELRKLKELKELKKLKKLKTILLSPIIYPYKTIVFNSSAAKGCDNSL